MIRLTLNGRMAEYNGDGDLKLIEWLRFTMNTKSVKDGCSGQGACGACLVELNGKPMLSCSITMEKLDGAEVVTLEGFPEDVRDILAKAFVAAGAVQCGFCSPGMLARAKMILEKNPSPTREEVAKKLKPHLCRCTGYVKIIDAVLLAAEKLSDKTDIDIENAFMGSSPPKLDALERAKGAPLFIGGLEFENIHHGALKFSDHPRARILSIDTSEAEKYPGVVKVLTAKDVPGSRNVGMFVRDWPLYVAEGETTRYIGDVLACVIADDNRTARKARELIKVEYEVLEPVTDPFKSLAGDVRIHENGNILKETVINYGEPCTDVFKESEYVIQKTYQTQRIEHAFLELENSVACREDGKLTVYTQSQGIYEDRHQIADMLGLEAKDVNVKLIAAGGAFGGKEDLTVQGHAALGAYILDVPVKVKLNRAESLRMHPKRHPMTLEYTLSCDKEGKFTGLHARITADTGAYASAGGPVSERAATHAGGAYHIPNIDVKSTAVYTNNIPSGAMRGFGVNQATFAIESIIDELCDKFGFDRWDIRYKNALDKGLTTTSGHKLRKAVGLKETLERVKDEFRSSKYAGIACAIKNCGIGNGVPELSQVKIEVLPEGRLRLYHGWSEMGQGIDTVAQQMLCEHIGLSDISKVDVVVMTDSETKGGSTTASRGTFLVGKAVIECAKGLKKDLQNSTLEELAGKVYHGEYLCDWTTKPDIDGDVISHFAYSFATQLVKLDNEGAIEKVTAVHDSGRVVNRKLFEGQIEGGVVMGIGYALSEDMPLDNGYLKTERFRDYGLLRTTDVPEIDVVPIEIDDIDAPFGAKGVGEICCIPTAAAVAGAYRSYDGAERLSLPLKPLNKK
ncbi:selenium-dependent xanthine dehydrogenase [Limisalsivibrio acetivorans]|uniref:selenium-dependent xanthine dehydrogenase n=1 Tax=Limisalsivibrio acetivorans TaxID=1304888 RepID=UPI0003B31D36|nr:selenium-dependent xanthine dehydrogenase [Limisalsivibrio acetivorans]